MFEITGAYTGKTFVFNSEKTQLAAEAWYETTEKADIIAFCSSHGLDLLETEGVLIDDWADAAMELYARVAAKA